MGYTPIVQELVDYLDNNTIFRKHFEETFKRAYDHYNEIIEEFQEYNVHSLDEYLRFMDKYVHWIPSENKDATNVLHHICFFHFILDLPTLTYFQSPVNPATTPPYTWLSDWLIRYAKAMGEWMDTPASLTKETLETFYQTRDEDGNDIYHMKDYPVPAGGWKTFNQFFARHIDPKVRPVAGIDEPTIITSPADCAYGGSWPVDEGGVTMLKGIPWHISQLLDNDGGLNLNLGKRFAGGTFTHSFLNTTDYHRQHAPVAGKVIEAKVIPGLCYLEVGLKPADETSSTSFLSMGEGSRVPSGCKFRLGWHRAMTDIRDEPSIISLATAEKLFNPEIPPAPPRHAIGYAGTSTPSAPASAEERDLTAPNSPGYQFIQARGLILIESEIGVVAVLPIGMAQVSSVVLSVKKGDVVKKGDEISCFHLGGSDIVMVFEKDANVQFDQVKDRHYNFGERVATATVKKSK